jgi:GNAT superfamily N-acetyltransferase
VTDYAVDLYAAAFAARWSKASAGDSVRLLVTDDRGHSRLVTELSRARQGVVVVFDTAPRCNELLRSRPGWKANRPATAMVLPALDAVPAASLPDGLVLRPVDTVASGAPGTVPLEAAAAAAIAADPGITDPPDVFVSYLRRLPSTQLFAAVDEAGVVRATSGCEVFGEYARIIFVNTERAWRGRGIGRAMTVAALRAASSSGARRALLDATDDGTSVYARLGFETAGRLTRYERGA